MAHPGDFGSILRRLRTSAGLTQEALAERAGVSAKALSDLERRTGRLPRLSTIALVADALALDEAERRALLAVVRPVAATAAPDPDLVAALPLPTTPLVGREGVTAAVAELVLGCGDPGGSRLVTLTGPGGVGKTRLAVAVAARVAGGFADGVRFVDLAPLADPALVLPAIARAVGVDDRDRLPLREQLAALLARRHLLLLLDNMEHLLAAREEVQALLAAAPRLSVLATSRAALRLRGEHCYRVAPLEVPAPQAGPDALGHAPAARLFLARARATGATIELTAETASAVADICRRLDGLPLALELAAAWAPLMPPRALAERLRPALPLLVDGPADLPRRQQTMRDAIAWSYDLLEPPEQRLFRALTIFSGGCTLATATALCSDPGDVTPERAATEPGLLAAFATLVDRSLVRSEARDDLGDGEPRLAMLEMLGEFGREQLRAHGELEPLQRRHTAHYLALAESAAREDAAAPGPAALRQEQDNLRAVLERAIEQGDGETALRLAGALWRFWDDEGVLTEGRQWLDRALALPGGVDAADPAARLRALVGAARLAIAQGAHDVAGERADEAAPLARQIGPGPDLADVLNVQGQLARVRGAYDEAGRCHEEALGIARALADRSREAAALTGLGYATTYGGDPDRGERLCEESLDLLRGGRDRRALAAALLGLADTISHRGAFARSEALAEEALAVSQATGDRGGEMLALWTLGAVAVVQGHHARAAAFLERDLALHRERGDDPGAHQPLTALGLIALRQGEPDRARRLIEEALAALDRLDDPWARAMTLTMLGHVDVVIGAEAAARLGTAIGIMRGIGNYLYLPWCLEGLAEVAAGDGAWVAAARLCGAHAALREGLWVGVPPVRPEAHARLLARCRAALGDDAFAAEHAAGSALTPEQAADFALRVAEE